METNIKVHVIVTGHVDVNHRFFDATADTQARVAANVDKLNRVSDALDTFQSELNEVAPASPDPNTTKET